MAKNSIKKKKKDIQINCGTMHEQEEKRQSDPHTPGEMRVIFNNMFHRTNLS